MTPNDRFYFKKSTGTPSDSSSRPLQQLISRNECIDWGYTHLALHRGRRIQYFAKEIIVKERCRLLQCRNPAEQQGYYFKRPDIHTLGNTGVGGSLHANVAPLATKIIDTHAYKGKDVRSMVSKDLRFMIKQPGVRIVDLCCGVGISTKALESAFSDAEFIVG